MSSSNASEDLRQLLDRLDWVFRVRPMPLAEALVKVLAPEDRRRCVDTPAGVRMFIDPLSNLGRAVVKNASYEPEVVELFRTEVKRGATVVDIGANEGYFAALAASLAGPKGRVIAVEPQRRLQALLEVNFRLNGLENFTIIPAAIGEHAGTERMYLAPTLNHGASSLFRRSRLWFRTQAVEMLTCEQLFARAGIDTADVVKVDVEGFEDKVIASLLPLIRARRVRTLLLDYHLSILEGRGVQASTLHEQLQSAGMRASGPPEQLGYVVYRAP